MEENNIRKKLLIFEPLAHISGGQRVLLNLLPYFKKYFDLTVVLPGPGILKDKLDELGIATIFINPGLYPLGKKNILAAIKYLCLSPLYFCRVFPPIKKFDLLYVNGARLLPIVVAANFLNQRPIIWHSHSLISDEKSLRLVEAAAGRRTVKKIIAVSDFIVSADKKLKDKTIVIYNGVDKNIFYPDYDKSDMKGNREIQIGVIGDLIPTKGQDTLLAALAKQDSKNWRLKIIGGSRPGHEGFAAELVHLADSLGLSDRIEFLGRRQPEEIAGYLRTLDLLVLPSIVAEACPMAVLEALACGVPVIVSDLGGTKEIVEDDQTGYLFRAGVAGDLAEKLNRFFNLSQDKLSALRLNRRREAERKFDLIDVAEEIRQIIDNILESI